MTESEWLECGNPMTLLEFLNRKISERKLRLFAYGCYRRFLGFFNITEREILAAERFADALQDDETTFEAHELIKHNALDTARWSVHDCCCVAEDSPRTEGIGEGAEKLALCGLFRCITGNPFRPIIIHPMCLTPTVLTLAQSAYDERILPSGNLDPERLAVLSDALEEAGCDDAAILDHLRSPGPHVRGCWAVDLLLGRK